MNYKNGSNHAEDTLLTEICS